MNRKTYSEAFTRNRLPDDADAGKDLDENADVVEESYLKRLKSIAIQLMTSSSSSLERSEQLEESKTDRDKQCTLTSSCSFSRMLESVGDIDEIVKCARDNIDEASKILAKLKHRKLQNKRKKEQLSLNNNLE